MHLSFVLLLYYWYVTGYRVPIGTPIGVEIDSWCLTKYSLDICVISSDVKKVSACVTF